MFRFILVVPFAAFCAFLSSGQGYFTENMGQWEEDVLFRSSAASCDVFLTSQGITVLQDNGDVVEYTVQSASQSFSIVPSGRAPHGTNYFYGNDPRRWVTDVPSWSRVRYSGDTGSSVVFALTSQGLSCELSGDVNLRRRLNGVDELDIFYGQILIGALQQFQFLSQVEAAFCTYLGASGEDRSYSIAFGSDGKVYVTGRTNSTDFPTENPYQGSYGGGDWDVFVTCFSTDGSQLFYSTYLGGSAAENGYGIKVDDEGCAHVTGPTESGDFPLQNAFQSTLGGTRDAFVFKLSAAGNSLSYSTYLGGSGEETGRDIAVDGTGGAYITGTTSSGNFPLQDPWQGSNAGGTDAFFTKLASTGDSLLCSTYIGGSADEIGEGIAVDPTGNTVVTGTTSSADFPTVSPVQGTYGGNTDGYVAGFSPSGQTVQFSTYLGGSQAESAENVSASQNGIAVTGRTASSDFPTVNPIQSSLPGTEAVFVTRYNSTGSSQNFSTFIGGTQNDYGRDLALAEDGSIFVTGYTSSTDFPVVDPWQEFYAGGSNDCFVLKIAPDDTLEYSTYLGGSGNDSSRSLALLTGGGAMAVTGGVFSTDFPTLNPYQGNHGGGLTDCFVALFTDEPQSAEGGEEQPGSAITLGLCSNPATVRVSITLGVPEQMQVNLGIYDLSGRLMDTIIPGTSMDAGVYTIFWNSGEMPAGVYLLRASAVDITPAIETLVII